MRKIIYICSMVGACFMQMSAQRAIEVTIEVMRPYPANLNYYLDNADVISITFHNMLPQEQHFYYDFELKRNGQSIIQAVDPSIFSIFEDPLTVESSMSYSQTGRDIGDRFGEFMLDDFMFGEGFNPTDIFTNMILPEGNYELLVTAYDFITDEPLSEPGMGEFEVEHGDPPVINNIENGGCVLRHLDGAFIINWSDARPPMMGGFMSDIEYKLEIFRHLVDDLEGSLMQPPLLVAEHLPEPFYNVNIEDDQQALLSTGEQYIAVITATDANELIAFKNAGQSELIHFELCEQLEVTAAYPSANISVPFRPVPIIAGLTPGQPKATHISAHIFAGEIPDQDFFWQPDIASQIGESDYSKFLVGNRVTSQRAFGDMQRGQRQSWYVDILVDRNQEVIGTNNLIQGTSQHTDFIFGMPPPALQFPQDGYSSRTYEVGFDWSSGNNSGGYFPPQEVLEESGLVSEFLTSVHEKMVFQLATTDRFATDEIVAQENYLLKFDDINLFGPDNSQAFADSALFGTTDILPEEDNNIKVSKTLFGNFHFRDTLNPGTYYWRVFYLTNPEMPVNLPRTFISEEYYHMSEVRTLTINENLENDCLAGCLFVKEAQLTGAALGDQTLDTIFAGHFPITQLNISANSAGRVSGTGVAVMPNFLLNIPIRVAFNNIRINFHKHLIEGEIRSVHEDNVLSFTIDTFSQEELLRHDYLGDYNELVSVGRLIANLAGGEPVGLPIGVDFDIQGYQAVLGLNRVTFKRDRADADFLLTVPLPFDGYTKYLPFGGSICLSPNGYEDAGLIHLTEDVMALDFGEGADHWSMFFAGASTGQVQQGGCFLEFDCHGAKTFALRGGVRFPRTWLVPDGLSQDLAGEGRVEGSFDIRLDRNNDQLGRPSEGLQFIAGIDLDPFQLASLPDIGFVVEEVYLDLSDVENAPGFAFPEAYESGIANTEMVDTWRGVFIKTAEMRFPSGFFGLPNRISTGLNRILIDETGVTLNAFVGNLGEASSPTGALGGFSISLDTVQLRVVQNNIEAFELKGDLGVPLLRREDRLAYTAGLNLGKLDQDTIQYIFDVRPKDEVRMPFLMAQANLTEATRLNVTYNQSLAETANDGPYNMADGFVFDLMLAGEITISDAFVEANEIDLPSTITLPKLPFEIGYHSRQGFNNSRVDWGGFEDPSNSSTNQTDDKKEIGGFPIQLTAFDFGSRAADNASVSDITLTIGAQLMLMENSLGVGASVVLIGGILDDGQFGLKDVEFGCLNIEAADVMGFGISGEFCYFNNREDDLGAAGVTGTVKILGAVDAELAFGVQKEQDKEYLFAYGLGQFHLPPPGIPIGQTGVSIFGCGLGFGWNTAKPELAPAYVSNDVAATSEGTYQLKYRPTDGRIWAKANVLLGGVLPESFHIDVELALEFQTEEEFGFRSGNVTGTGYVMTPLDQHDRSPIKFTLASELRFPRLYDQFEFIVNADVFVQMMPFDGARFIKGTMDPSSYLAGNLFFMLNNTEDNGDLKWYVHAGKYGWDDQGEYVDQLMGLGLSIPGMESLAETELQAYAMLGQDIPAQIRPLPVLIEEILNDGSGQVNGALQRSDIATARTGPPLMGSGITFGGSLTRNMDIDAILLRAKLETAVGFDINLTHAEGRQTCAGSEAGANGWYGTGQAYAGLRGNMGVVLPEWLHDLNGGEDVFTLFFLEAAIAVTVGGPNPFWLEGRGRVAYDVFGGLLKGEENFYLQLGEKCSQPQGNPLANIRLIASANPPNEPDPFTGLSMENAAIDLAPTVQLAIPYNETYSYQRGDDEIEMRLQVDSFFLAELNAGTPSPLAASEHFVAGQQEISIRPHAALKLNQTYLMKVVVRIYERENGGGWQPTTKDDFLYTAFRTSSTVQLSEAMVSYTYPPRDQHFFLVGEHEDAQGKIVLNQDISNQLPPNYHYEVYLSNADQSDEHRLAVTPPAASAPSKFGRSSEKAFRFDLPDLLTNQNYQLILRGYQSFDEQTTTSSNTNNPINSASQFVGAAGANMVANLQPFISIPQTIYAFEFNTSQYHSFEEKINATTISFVVNESSLTQGKGHLILQNAEGFDQYDIRGITSAFGDQVAMPFFQFQDNYQSSGHAGLSEQIAYPYQYIQSSLPNWMKFKVSMDFEKEIQTRKGVYLKKTPFEGDFDKTDNPNITFKIADGKQILDGGFNITVPSYPGHQWFDVAVNQGSYSGNITGISLPVFNPVPVKINKLDVKNYVVNGQSALPLRIDYDVLTRANDRFTDIRKWYYQLLDAEKTYAINSSSKINSGKIFFKAFSKAGNLLEELGAYFIDPDQSLLGTNGQQFDLEVLYSRPGAPEKTATKSYQIQSAIQKEKE